MAGMLIDLGLAILFRLSGLGLLLRFLGLLSRLPRRRHLSLLFHD
ncbi:MAG TPA: hypothetical protein VII63_13315 [Caulobacteraceae bacterium]